MLLTLLETPPPPLVIISQGHAAQLASGGGGVLLPVYEPLGGRVGAVAWQLPMLVHEPGVEVGPLMIWVPPLGPPGPT
jgi:hypothetical protein